ncbi:MAG: hypothetical protein G01um101430_19 [Parcubacteria group bacterium Gr01-1014_30]|nr:MAG: hypothetical protein G01um101430_19 [Parcubacteria group bacterium Gr01-1014_30]
MFKSVNKVIKTLVFYDLILLFGWGLVVPIVAIFIVENIKGGNAQVAGVAIGVYWLLKSALQVPIANYLDKNHGERDDYYFLVGGTILASLTPVGFIFASLPWHIYLLQALHALGMAAAVPAWAGIFTRHINRGKEAQSWALDSSAVGIGMGASGIVGGAIAEVFGFTPVFILVGILGIISALLLFLIKEDLSPKGKVFPMPKPQ